MIDQLTKGISSLAPFLEPYASWVKVLFSVWVLTTAILLLSLVLARPKTAKQPVSLPQVGESDQDVVWLTINRAELYGSLEGGQIQVTARVNGTEFKYPTLEGIEWLVVGPQMASQQFRVPPANSYEVSFRAQARKGDLVELISVSTVQISALPYSSRYNLFRKEDRARGASVEASVFYKLSANP